MYELFISSSMFIGIIRSASAILSDYGISRKNTP
jgi:hypothetical protein